MKYLRVLMLSMLFSTPYAKPKECGIGSYYDRIQNTCVDCGKYPEGCTVLDPDTHGNCMKNCKSKFIFLVKLFCLKFHNFYYQLCSTEKNFSIAKCGRHYICGLAHPVCIFIVPEYRNILNLSFAHCCR